VPNRGACHRGAKPGYQKQAQYQCCAVAFFWVLKFRQNVKNKFRKGLLYHDIPFFLKKIKFLKKIRNYFWGYI
jgi:hypothetical protein